MKKKILSIFTLLFVFVGIVPTVNVFALDTSTTTIEGTNINITNGENGSDGTQNNTSTTDNSVNLVGVGNSLSNLVETINTAGREYETGDINGDNIPDVIEFYDDRIVIYEYSVMGLNYIKSMTITKEYVLDQLKLKLPGADILRMFGPVPYPGHKELVVSSTKQATITLDFDEITFKDFYFTKNEHSSNRGIIGLSLHGKAHGVSSGQCPGVSWRSASVDYFNGQSYSRGVAFIDTIEGCKTLSETHGSYLLAKEVGEVNYNVLFETTSDIKKQGLNMINYTKTYKTKNTGNVSRTQLTGSINGGLYSNVQYQELDANTDGMRDLIIYNDGTNKISSNILGQYIYNSSSKRYETQNTTSITGIDLGIFENDINHDTLEDAVFVNPIEGTENQNVSIYTNQNGSYEKSLELLGVTGIDYVDLNHDSNSINNGAKDIISYVKNGDTYVYKVLVYNKATKTYINVLEGDEFTGGKGYEVIDFTGDGNLDLVFKKDDGFLYFYEYTGDTSGTLKYVTKIEGNDFKMLTLNADNQKDLVTRTYIGLFQNKRFHKYNIYFYDPASKSYLKKTNSPIISSGVDVWAEQYQVGNIKDFDGDGVKDAISKSSTTSSLYYYNFSSDSYEYLDKIKNTNVIGDYVNFSDKTVILIDSNNLLKIFEKNSSTGKLGETTKTFDRENLMNFKVSQSSIYRQFVDMGNIKLNDLSNSRVYTANNGKTIHVIRNKDGKVLLINNNIIGGDSVGVLYITKTTSPALTSSNKFTAIRQKGTSEYEYFYSDNVMSQGFKNGISKFSPFNLSKTTKSVTWQPTPVFVYNGKNTGLLNTASNIEKSRGAYIVEKVVNRDLSSDFLAVQKHKSISTSTYASTFIKFLSFQNKVIIEDKSKTIGSTNEFLKTSLGTQSNLLSIDQFIPFDNFEYTNSKTNNFTYNANGNKIEKISEQVSCSIVIGRGCFSYNKSCIAADSKGGTHTLSKAGRTCSRSGVMNNPITLSKQVNQFGGGRNYTLKILNSDGTVYNGNIFTGIEGPGQTIIESYQKAQSLFFPDYDFEKKIDEKINTNFSIVQSFKSARGNNRAIDITSPNRTLFHNFSLDGYNYGTLTKPITFVNVPYQSNGVYQIKITAGGYYQDMLYCASQRHDGPWMSYKYLTSCNFGKYFKYSTIKNYD